MTAGKIDFSSYDDDMLKNYISDFKKRYGKRLLIPAHYYVSSDVFQFADITGDSYKLAVDATKSDAEWVVFCGVRFMAEGVDILCPDKKVIIPDLTAGCPMADMADIESGRKALSEAEKHTGKRPVPVVYMNSYADSKSLCGENGGTVCTSSNAEKIVKYYLDKGESVFFFPDANLGKNTANALNLADNETALIKNDFTIEFKGNPDEVRVFLWDGFCHVHRNFQQLDISSFRQKYPEGKIIVHPEVDPQVDRLADMHGSTQKIYNLIKDSPDGSVWGVGTEVKFVERVAEEFSGKTVVPVRTSVCGDMSKINLKNLAASLNSIELFEAGEGELLYPVSVKDEYRENALKALDQMIRIVEEK